MIASTLIEPIGYKNGPMYGKATRASGISILSIGRPGEELDMLFRQLAEDHCVFLVNSENAALRLLERQSIHLIISSIGVFNSKGAEFCAQLKRSDSYSPIPVILLIDEVSVFSRMKCLESGADAFLEPPFSGKLLKAQVKNILANRARIREQFVLSMVADTVPNPVASGRERFLDRLNGFIGENLSRNDLNADLLARMMNMSRPTLYRKVKSSSHLTINELINISRLSRAAVLLSTGDRKIAEVAKTVGFCSRRNFGKAFLKHFNLTPSAYQQLKKAL